MSDPGRPIHQDLEAESADPDLPAFIARPEGKPVYYGFPVLDVEVDGFRLGAISGFAIEELDNADEDGTWGDAFVIGPDGRRAGLIWEVERGPAFALAPAEDGDQALASRERVGVYNVSFPRPMRSLEDARANLEAIVPLLRKEWER